MDLALRGSNSFAVPTRAVFAASLALGSLAVLAEPRAGLLAAAVVFGWTQIGGA